MAATSGAREKSRLRRGGEFDRVFAEGIRVHGSLLTVVGRANPGALRLGVPCGRRYSKRAVDRNRFRRLVREAFRAAERELPRGLDVVVLPRCRPGAARFDAFAREIPELVAKLARNLARREAAAP